LADGGFVSRCAHFEVRCPTDRLEKLATGFGSGPPNLDAVGVFVRPIVVSPRGRDGFAGSHKVDALAVSHRTRS